MIGMLLRHLSMSAHNPRAILNISFMLVSFVFHVGILVPSQCHRLQHPLLSSLSSSLDGGAGPSFTHGFQGRFNSILVPSWPCLLQWTTILMPSFPPRAVPRKKKKTPRGFEHVPKIAKDVRMFPQRHPKK